MGLRCQVPGKTERFQDLDKPQTPLGERGITQIVARMGQQVEGDELGRRLLRQHVYPGLGRMDALLQGVEICDPTHHNHHFTVDDGPGRKLFQRRP